MSSGTTAVQEELAAPFDPESVASVEPNLGAGGPTHHAFALRADQPITANILHEFHQQQPAVLPPRPRADPPAGLGARPHHEW